MRCKECGNTETFKRRYDAVVTQRLDFPRRAKTLPMVSDTDIDGTPPWYESEDEYWCIKCLSDNIDLEGFEA